LIPVEAREVGARNLETYLMTAKEYEARDAQVQFDLNRSRPVCAPHNPIADVVGNPTGMNVNQLARKICAASTG
jgi:hypothetical protein